VRTYSIMTEKQFDKMSCQFNCEFDPRTMEPFNQSIDKAVFVETENEDHSYLFKLAAKEGLEQGSISQKEHIQEVALKYQLLTKHTELVGISKVKQQPDQAQPQENFKSAPPLKAKRVRMQQVQNLVMSQQDNFQCKQ